MASQGNARASEDAGRKYSDCCSNFCSLAPLAVDFLKFEQKMVAEIGPRTWEELLMGRWISPETMTENGFPVFSALAQKLGILRDFLWAEVSGESGDDLVGDDMVPVYESLGLAQVE